MNKRIKVRFYLVPKHGIELVEHVLAEAGAVDGDGAAPPPDAPRRHVRDDGLAEAAGWGGIEQVFIVSGNAIDF